MKLAGLLIGVLMMTLGLVGLGVPGWFILGAEYTLTPTGLYVIAAFRIAVGVMLVVAASASRLPRTMRVFGVIALAAGLTTPLMGVERARAIFTWSALYGAWIIRVWGAIALAVGGIIAFAFSSRRAV